MRSIRKYNDVLTRYTLMILLFDNDYFHPFILAFGFFSLSFSFSIVDDETQRVTPMFSSFSHSIDRPQRSKRCALGTSHQCETDVTLLVPVEERQYLECSAATGDALKS